MNHENHEEMKELSGNEALARGAVVAGVSVAASYPGEPVSIPVEILAKDAERNGMHVQWSVNEKVAYEVALGASYAGLRSIVFVKHVGFNWIMDPFVGSAYTGVKGGLVVVVGDDPEAAGSTNEEDTRYLTEVAEAPLLEPSTPNEAKEMVAHVFDISERVKLPVVVRVVTRLCKQLGPVGLGGARAKNKPSFGGKWFVKEALLSQHAALHEKNLLLERMSEESSFNTSFAPPDAKIGIIACGSASQFAEDLVKTNPGRLALLKVGFVGPPPRGKIRDFAKSYDKILVVEEVQPFLEAKVRQTLSGVNSEVFGKLSGHLPWVGSLTHDSVCHAVEKMTGWKPRKPQQNLMKSVSVGKTSLYELEPCSEEFDESCPHRSTFMALRAAIKKSGLAVTVTGDVGCMSLDIKMGDPVIESMTCMGASPSVAAGLKIASPERRLVAVIGDSSFYHSGFQGVMNNIHNGIPVTTLILDNMITAQSGFQPAPGTPHAKGAGGRATARVEELLRSIGSRVVVVDSFKPDEVERILSEALERDDSTAIVSRGRCPIAEKVRAYPSELMIQ
jgi:indolepyruvate ferredoxin oxidoreductase alpha subunit